VTATIEPLMPDATERPFWSVMIPTYNGDPHLIDTLECVLAQDPGPDEMQIEVVDDRSTRGDPEALTRKVGGDRVSFFRQPANLGHSGNFNTCIRRARGEVVHILHDDDRVRPGFYERLGAPLRDDPSLGGAFTRNIYADADGHWRSFSPVERSSAGIIEDWLFRIASGQRTTTPAVVVRRSVYEALGGFDQSVRVGGEDWEMWVRIATRYPVWFEPEPLAVYRMNRPGSLTGEALGTVGLARDMLAMADTVESYLFRHLPADRAEHALRRARSLYSSWAIDAAYALARADERAAALTAAKLAFRTERPSAVLRSLARTALRTRRPRGVRT
jgi:glycosyltransferase involved in cell wall biosynthesis